MKAIVFLAEQQTSSKGIRLEKNKLHLSGNSEVNQKIIVFNNWGLTKHEKEKHWKITRSISNPIASQPLECKSLVHTDPSHEPMRLYCVKFLTNEKVNKLELLEESITQE